MDKLIKCNRCDSSDRLLIDEVNEVTTRFHQEGGEVDDGTLLGLDSVFIRNEIKCMVCGHQETNYIKTNL